ncbi:apolipoprotein N-acyltransferase [Corynebacterium qintianiae]|uniref:Apolipoprotein N-acyltransferase n=1 Tax=Corynebacterium qintianiae TaxID=2709392 RepID=A0A7T0PET8_9CORY|nr:apolipoprotein N-acyltransferase [Corynebacterium qintianiae]QPK84178.1 apolipoprotein N-acyltransferase [Corynebacterium qintianiae]
MRAFLRFALSAASGAAVYLSYEPHGMWVMGILGIALFHSALSPWPASWNRFTGPPRGERPGPSGGFGALLGFTHALFCYLYLLPWIGEFVGTLPYVALSLVCALYAIATGIFGALAARRRWGFFAFPFIYLAVEWARSSFPFGGFPWVRLAWGQINGPLANLAAWGGPALVTLATVLTGCGVAAVIVYARANLRAGIFTAALPVVLGLIAQIGVDSDRSVTGESTVSAVQGNVPRMGLDFNAQRRAVLANHVNQTIELAESGAEPDIVIWPENSSDVNPFTDPEAAALIKVAVTRIDAPVLVGTLTRDEVGQRNTMQVFDPDSGAGDYHHKKYLQPFGEYMPMRDFFRNFSEYVDMAGNFKPGSGNGVVTMAGIRVGIATCYEVAVDEAYRSAVRNGAAILTTPTNNATFGFTDMTYQQLAMSRMRAIETDRAVVVAATSGVSGIVHPDGTVSQHTGIFEPAHLTETLPLKNSVTPAVAYGRYLEWLGVAAGLFLMLAALAASRRGYDSGKSFKHAHLPKEF